jgi:hypothetical protein
MRLITALFFTLSFSAQASGWMDVTVLPGTVLTQSGEGVIAIMKEAGSMPSTGYECTLSVKASESQLEQLGTFDRSQSWTRLTLGQPLNFSDAGIRYELKLDADRGSECLEYGEEYYEDGHWTRDCIRHAGNFRTMKSILVLRDSRRKIDAMISCEKWMSDKKIDLLDGFFHVLQRRESYFPLFLDLELD